MGAKNDPRVASEAAPRGSFAIYFSSPPVLSLLSQPYACNTENPNITTDSKRTCCAKNQSFVIRATNQKLMVAESPPTTFHVLS